MHAVPVTTNARPSAAFAVGESVTLDQLDRDPYPVLAELRAAEPVSWVPVLDGWLVIECDSKEFHEKWQQQVKDRERDLALASRGFVVLRLTAAQIMYRPDEVRAAICGLLTARASDFSGCR